MKLKPLLFGLAIPLVPCVASAEILSVKTTSANFRQAPNEAAPIKFSADQFYPVEVVTRKNGWAQVRDFEGDEAWVAERLLVKRPTVVIAADKANIREAAKTGSDVLFKVERGEVFKVEERKGQWLKVADVKGDGGWIRDDMTWGEATSAGADKPKISADKADKSDKSQKTDKSDKSDTSDKPASTKELVALPANVEQICRAYEQQQTTITIAKDQGSATKMSADEKTPASDKKSEPKTKATKVDKKKSDKPAAKPKG